MQEEGWRSLLRREWLLTLAVLLGGVLMQSMNVLLLATVLPSIVGELGGAALLSWPNTAFLASSIVAASCAGMLASAIGGRTAYCTGVATFGVGALLCSLATTMGWVVAGRFVQGFGGGLEAAIAYVMVRRTFPEAMWSRTIALMSGSWSMSVLLGPLVGGMFARFGSWRSAFVATTILAGILAVSALFVLPPEELDHRVRRVLAGQAVDPGDGVGAGAAQEQSGHRGPVAGEPRCRPAWAEPGDDRVDMVDVAVDGGEALGDVRLGQRAAGQIGRASCRERVSCCV